MKRTAVFMLAIMLLVLSACTGAAPQTQVPSPDQTVSTPSPTKIPTPVLTATPEPISEDMEAFSLMPGSLIFGVYYDSLPNMDRLLTDYTYLDLGNYDPTSERNHIDLSFIVAFKYLNYSEKYDETTGSFTRSADASDYDITMNVTDENWYLEDLSDFVGEDLGLEYSDETITSTSSDGTQTQVTQKWAEGSEESYSSSWVYYDSEYADEGAMRLTFVYPGQNEEFNTLVSESFARLTVPIPARLQNYESTYEVDYSKNPNSNTPDVLVGSVGQTWWDISAEDAMSLIGEYETDGSFSAIHSDDYYHEYYIALEDEYFEGVSIRIMLWDEGTGNNDALYYADYIIYYKNVTQQ
jgi:hypothetical protein